MTAPSPFHDGRDGRGGPDGPGGRVGPDGPDGPGGRGGPGRGWRLVRVVGDSMRPTLSPGDVLLVRRTRHPSPGDVVVADLPDGRGEGVKRAVRREPDGWWLERDSDTTGTDSWLFGAVPDTDVRGVVRARLWPRPGRLRRR